MTTAAVVPLADTLGEFATAPIAPAARDPLADRAKLHILDAIGIALASTTMEDGYADRVAATASAYRTEPECTVIGMPLRASAPVAAFVNGSLVHGCDFDDIYYERTVHTEGVSVPPVLAVGERLGRTGAEIIDAWIVATEVCLRMALGCSSTESLYDTGFHTTAIFGTFGAAAGASRLLGLGEREARAALSLAPSFAAGTAAGWTEGTGRNKSLQPGWASMAGVHAALLASNGYECATTTIDGPTGLYASHSWRHGFDPADVVAGLGDEWRLLDLAFKLHPAGGMVQSAIDATLALVREHGVAAADVEDGEIVVPAQYREVLAEIAKDIYEPASGYTGFSSWPCNVARVLLTGHVGVEHMRLDAVRDPALLDLARRLRCVADEDETPAPADRPTVVRLRTSRGTFEARRGRHAGHPGPHLAERVVEKFRRTAALRLDDDRVERILETVLALERVDDVRDLTRLLAVDDDRGR